MQTRSAASVAATAVTAAQLIGAQWNPSPTHPRTALWYASLRKPSFTPPGPVFAIAWTVLDGLQAYAGYRLLKERPSAARSAALGAWALNLLGVAGFSWVLFGRKRLGEALGVTSGMVVTAATAAGTATLVDRRAGAASLPLLAWVTFAAVLQEEVWQRNT